MTASILPTIWQTLNAKYLNMKSQGLPAKIILAYFQMALPLAYTTQPLFGMVVRKDCLLDSIYTKLNACAAQGWCCLEPEDRTDWFIVKPDSGTPPIIHINMNTTGNNHHLTNHYDIYSIETAQERHTFWGDYRRFGIFTDEDVEAATKPILPRGTYRIVDATYGSFDSDRTVSYLHALERKAYRGLFRVSNTEAGLDPAPGVLKSLHLKVLTASNSNRLNYEFKEGSIFCL